MNVENLRSLINDLESDCVERTISTGNTDKFGQAICAFANDLPNHHIPGYLILGVEDDGKVKGVHVTDDLLKNLAAIRTDGNIQPQPSMTVEKVSMPEGDVVVVKVEPSIFPPVKYKGRVWVRIGPRKGVANENDEHILLEKRRTGVVSYDASPCIGATLQDLDLSLFKYYYLPKAMPEDVLEEDKRDVKLKLSAFGFFDLNYDAPTHAGMLFFAKNLRRFIPGAYVQYVKFAGSDRASDIMTEHEFKENLCTILPELDTFIKTTITNRRPIPVSSAREENVVDYPDWATRELLMNAICHRDYSSHGPIQFYQYDNRIEIMNHGGLYGRANETNFPNVNDYRNIVVAEGMKVLGFVNRHSRGVLRVQKDLVENENGEAVFDFLYQTAIVVRENKSPRGERMMAEAIANGFVVEESKNAYENGHGRVNESDNGHEYGHKNGHESVYDSKKGHEKGHESVYDSKKGHENGHESLCDSKKGHENGHESLCDCKNGHKNGHESLCDCKNGHKKGHESLCDCKNGHKKGHGSLNEFKNGQKNGHESLADSKNGHRNGHESVNEFKDGHKKGHKKGHGLTNNHFTSDIVRNIYEVIKLNPKAKYSDIQDNLGISIATIRRAITDLKNIGFINSKPSKVKGVWQLIEQPDIKTKEDGVDD